MKQAADALQYAHEQKFIHRDVKPENMLVGRRDELLLSDFGIATVAHSSGSLSRKEAVGTLAYMAPEQIEGYPRAASDQYALGSVVYEWLCGNRPFEGSPAEVMVKQLRMPPPPLHEKVAAVPLDVEQVVLRALAKDSKERFASVRDFATALEQASLHAPSYHTLLAWKQTPLGESAEPDYAAVTIPPSQPTVPPETISSPPVNASSPEMRDFLPIMSPASVCHTARFTESKGRGTKHAQNSVGVLGMLAEPTGTGGCRVLCRQFSTSSLSFPGAVSKDAASAGWG